MKKFAIISTVLLIAFICTPERASSQLLWGLTRDGGEYGGGTVFTFNPLDGQHEIVYSFKGPNDPENPDGSGPWGSLLRTSDGKLFGTCFGSGQYNYGIVFELDPGSKEYFVRASFNGEGNGAHPTMGLVETSDHKIYGTTYYGGNYAPDDEYKMNGDGVLFEYVRSTHEINVLFKFDVANGKNPRSKLIEVNGKLYGTTLYGGDYGKGVVFEYDPAPGGTGLTLLHSFNGTDGENPFGALIAVNGWLYGMTQIGGNPYDENPDWRCGVIYKFKPSTDDPQFTIVHKFNDPEISSDGIQPADGFLLSGGYLYGMTEQGGINRSGTIFKIAPSFDSVGDSYEKIFDFHPSGGRLQEDDGITPTGILCKGSNGKLYGMTRNGGIRQAQGNYDTDKIDEWGVLFEFDPVSGSYAKKVDFVGPNGLTPVSNSMISFEVSQPPVAVCKPAILELGADGKATLNPSQIDGGSTGAGITLSASQTQFDCSNTGLNNVTLTVTDSFGAKATCSTIVTVVDPNPLIAIGKTITVQLDDSGNATITAADVDGGSSDPCGIVSRILDRYNFTCADAGHINIVILTVSDANGNTASCNVNVIVEDKTPPVAVCKNATVQLDASGTATITAADVDGGCTDNCGIAGLSIDKNSFTCANVGSDQVILTVTDENGNQSTCTAEVMVEDKTAPVAKGKNITVQLDATGHATIAAADVDGGSNDNCGIAGLSIDKNSFSCADVGQNTVILTITDVNGNHSSVDVVVTVAAADPMVVSVASGTSGPVLVSTAFKLLISLSDNSSHSVNVQWGDGTNNMYTANTLTLETFHTYSTPGVYVITVSVAAACGETTTVKYKYAVIYDPNAGFVTGGGWINSPAGAYVANPTLTGKANFSIEAKYKKGGSDVDGNVEFQFTTGKMNFKSVSVDAMSLVIAGPKAIYTGKGTINNVAGYSFLVSVIDGDLKSKGEPDKFRIKIWNTTTNVVVYDNQPGADDNVDAGTALGGGSIVIHKSGTKSAEIPVSQNVQNALNVYPNPFRELLNIDFTPAESGRTVIEITDLTGRTVSTLLDKNLEGGIPCHVEFKPDRLVDGIYLYRIIQDRQLYTGKVLFQK